MKHNFYVMKGDSMTIYLVEGTFGVWDDVATWIEKAFLNKNDAEKFIKSNNTGKEPYYKVIEIECE